MAFITSTTQTTPFSFPSQSFMDREPYADGYLWQIVYTSAGALQLWYSSNNGVNWTAGNSFTRANLQEFSGIFVDREGYIHIAYRVYESGRDEIYYRRWAGSWSNELKMTSVAAASAGAAYQGVDLVAIIIGGTTYVHAAVGTTSGSNIGVTMCSVTIKYTYDNFWFFGGYWKYTKYNELIQGTRQWFMSGSGAVRPSIDIRHSGDGHTGRVPDLWVSFGRNNISVVKIPYANNRWTGPTQAVAVATPTTPMDNIGGRFDGTRFLIPVLNGSTINVYERDISNTVSATRTSPAHPQGVIRYVAINYNPFAGDFRLYAVGTSNAALFYIDYARQSNNWSSWTSTGTTIASVNNFGTRRGAWGNARYDFYTSSGSSPFTLSSTSQVLVFAPSTPILTSPSNGASYDVASQLTFDWVFVDTDPGDTQAGYALSRQIGAGTIAYWQASTGTWVGGEVNNATSLSEAILPVGWGNDSDDNHTYRVKVWDSSGLPSGYSSAVTVVPSAKINPTITSPSAGETASILDTFTRSGELNGSSPTLGGNWSAVPGRWTTNGTQAAWVTSFNFARLSGTSGDQRVALKGVTIQTTATGVDRYWWLMGRADAGGGNFVTVRIGVQATGQTLVQIYVYVSGVATLVKEVINELPVQASLTIDMSLKIEGRTVTAYVGNVVIIATLTTTQFAAISGGTYGGMQADSTVTIDQFEGYNLNATVLTSSELNVTWSVASQRAFQIKLYEVASGIKVYDSNLITSQTQSYKIPYALQDLKSYRLELTTTNTEGLISNTQTSVFSVDFVEPAVPTFTVTPRSDLGLIRLQVINPEPTGLEPTVAKNDIYRRIVGNTDNGIKIASMASSTSLNLYSGWNYSFELSVTGQPSGNWASNNNSQSTAARVTAQSQLGTASIEQTAVSGTGFAGIYNTPTDAVPATPGVSYTLTVWVKATSGRTIAGYFTWRTAGGTNIGNSALGTVVANGSWQQITLVATAPATTAFMILNLGGSATANVAGEKCWVDNARVQITGATPQPVTEDDFTAASGVNYEYRSLVTAVNNTSVYTPWQA